MAMNDVYNVDRRGALKSAAVGALGTCLTRTALAGAAGDPPVARGNIKQSVCRWCYGRIPLAKLAAEAARIGYKSVELLMPEEFKEVKPYGLTCAMIRCASITAGLNRKENHDRIEQELRKHIEFAAAEGIPNVICMSGNRESMPDEEGLENCTIGLKR